MTTQNQNSSWKVEVRKMNGSDARVRYFNDYTAAYSYYCEKCDDLNLDNASYSNAAMNLDAGGRGYDYRVELQRD